VVLVVAEAAKTPLPAGTPFGAEGAPLWILPASQDPTLLYLGLSAEPPTLTGRPGIPSGVFNGNLTFRLKAVDGPGQFILWQNPSPGVFDIHSPRVPDAQEMLSLLTTATRHLAADQIWVNPDCGLKTRKWEEVRPALVNMVAAARELLTLVFYGMRDGRVRRLDAPPARPAA
jgi:hypothetical protein